MEKNKSINEAASMENYSNFILKGDKIVFIFPKYHLFSGNFGTTSIEIDYSDLRDYIKPDLFKVLTKNDKYTECCYGLYRC